MSDQLISTSEAAQILSVHRSRVDQMIREGKLQVIALPSSKRVTPGGWRYVSRSAVEALRQETEARGHKKKSGRPKRETAAG